MNRKSKTIQNRNAMINKRRSYRLAKREAKHQYNNEQNERLHNLTTNNPQSFWREIKKIKVKRSKSSNISHDQFFEHFENLYSNSDGFINDDVEEDISNIDDNINVEELDCDFTIEEVKRAISALKRGKSCGIDNLILEAFIESSEIIAPILCTLFNYMYLNNVYPSEWAKGVIVPVPNKGDPNNVNNYRGITLTSIFSQIFSILLDNRLRVWSESNNLLSDFQFGFRKSKSTVDCIFVVSSIIDKVINHEKKRLYCAFVDFQKAFNLVYRNGIWFKILNMGGSCKIVKMLQAIYSSVKSCVRTHTSNDVNSAYFDYGKS